MRPVSKFAAAFLASVAVVSTANAALLVSDSFSYPDGSLVNTSSPNTPTVGGPWAAHSAAGSTAVQVVNGAIAVAQGSGSREDVNVAFAGGVTATTGSVFYASFDLTVADPSATVTSAYFAHFLSGTTFFDSRVFIDPGSSSGYRVGLANGAASANVDSSDLAFGQTYKVVVSYDYTNKTGSLWINPTDASSPSISATDAGHSDAVGAFAFRQTSGNTTQMVDNLLVGTTFADVVAPTPEPASLGLLGLGAFGLLRRRSSR